MRGFVVFIEKLLATDSSTDCTFLMFAKFKTRPMTHIPRLFLVHESSGLRISDLPSVLLTIAFPDLIANPRAVTAGAAILAYLRFCRA